MMKDIMRRWKLGWRVLARGLLFGFALCLVGLVLRLCLMLAVVPEIALPEGLGTPLALVLALLTLGIVLPLGMYWAAQWTGYLQGSDKKEFGKIKANK
jgi:hypothetical protein